MRSRSRSAIGRSADLANSRLSPISIDPSRRSEPPLPQQRQALSGQLQPQLVDRRRHPSHQPFRQQRLQFTNPPGKEDRGKRTLVSPYSTSSSLPLFESACTSSRLHPSAALIFDRHAAHARSLAHVPTSAPRLGAEVHPHLGPR